MMLKENPSKTKKEKIMKQYYHNIITLLGSKDIIFPHIEELSDPNLNYDAAIDRKEDLGEVKYFFQTINKIPKKIYEKISRENPDTTFAVEYSNVDEPEDSGCLFFTNGILTAILSGAEMYGYLIQGYDFPDICGIAESKYAQLIQFQCP